VPIRLFPLFFWEARYCCQRSDPRRRAFRPSSHFPAPQQGIRGERCPVSLPPDRALSHKERCRFRCRSREIFTVWGLRLTPTIPKSGVASVELWSASKPGLLILLLPTAPPLRLRSGPLVQSRPILRGCKGSTSWRRTSQDRPYVFSEDFTRNPLLSILEQEVFARDDLGP